MVPAISGSSRCIRFEKQGCVKPATWVNWAERRHRRTSALLRVFKRNGHKLWEGYVRSAFSPGAGEENKHFLAFSEPSVALP